MKASDLSVSQLKEQSVAVLGIGRAGKSVVEYLLAHGVTPTVYTEAEPSEEEKRYLWQRGVRFFSQFPDVFPEDVLFRSPGIRPDIAPIRRALARGARLSGECDFFIANTKATVVGVTGSDGKTTTANMTAALLLAAGYRTVLGGNNGAPLLTHLDSLTKRDFAVVELSSFQLMTAPSPDIAVITNLSPNHLNWHTNFEEYVAAKRRIAKDASRLVVNGDFSTTLEIARSAPCDVTLFGHQNKDCQVLIDGDDLILKNGITTETVSVFREFSLLGLHNRENFAAAVAAVYHLVPSEVMLGVAREFKGVKHRLEHVDTVRGVRFVNSSIDTSPTRTVAALMALNCRPVVIAGGTGKGLALAPLADAFIAHTRAVHLYGATAREIARAIDGRLPAVCHPSFDAAFFAAAHAAVEGETVLLSPGCTAFGEFRDFEERGEVFCRLVEEWKREGEQNFGTSRSDSRTGGSYERNGI